VVGATEGEGGEFLNAEGAKVAQRTQKKTERKPKEDKEEEM
jgi:hypothetical protein